ncbi:MAG: hypothetical protein R3C04_07760 [Hyphomonas sp.]
MTLQIDSDLRAMFGLAPEPRGREARDTDGGESFARSLADAGDQDTGQNAGDDPGDDPATAALRASSLARPPVPPFSSICAMTDFPVSEVRPASQPQTAQTCRMPRLRPLPLPCPARQRHTGLKRCR